VRHAESCPYFNTHGPHKPNTPPPDIAWGEAEGCGGIGKRQQFGERRVLPYRNPIIAQKSTLTSRLAF